MIAFELKLLKNMKSIGNKIKAPVLEEEERNRTEYKRHIALKSVIAISTLALLFSITSCSLINTHQNEVFGEKTLNINKTYVVLNYNIAVKSIEFTSTAITISANIPENCYKSIRNIYLSDGNKRIRESKMYGSDYNNVIIQYPPEVSDKNPKLIIELFQKIPPRITTDMVTKNDPKYPYSTHEIKLM